MIIRFYFKKSIINLLFKIMEIWYFIMYNIQTFNSLKKIRKGNSSLFAHDFQNLEIKQEQQSYKTNEEENIL